jgi:NAD(P)-dependent dehydrogenase (short-subunit alcohol dehydrogenase family)
MAEIREKPRDFPPQKQEVHPGSESKMDPEPQFLNPNYKGSEKLKDKVALFTGGDSGIGRSIAIHFAREGAKVAIVYYEQHEDAQKTREYVEKEGQKALLIAGDVADRQFAFDSVEKTVKEFGRLDILVNHASIQRVVQDIQEVTEKELERIFKVNVFGYFYFAQAALKHLKSGGSIINTTSINAYDPNPTLLPYGVTKGAERTFTYALAKLLAPKGIRVNAVAPGPIWTPFIPSSFPPEKMESFGKTDTFLGRAGQPEEVAPCYVFLASDVCSSYITGQTLHPNGGRIAE